MNTIFVSSTFKDMHFERDAIQEITLPILRSEATQHGQSVSFCDLRWGINTSDLDSEEGSRKVLDVCLDEIDRCKPPMIVILGDRYGWIPSETLTTSAADRKKIDKAQLKKDMELEDLQISVTALEIAYGALSSPEKRTQALFYFRHIESECPNDYTVEDFKHKQKLDHLKKKIETLTNGRVKHYYVRWDGTRLDGVTSFAEMLAEDIKQVLLPEWRKKNLLTPFERERLTHWSFIEEKNEMFSARRALVQKYYDELTKKEQHFLAITAPSGSGKSMLFCNLALKLRDSGYDVIPFMSGLTSDSNDSVDILLNTIYYMEDLLEFPHEFSDFSFRNIEFSTNSQKGTGSESAKGIAKLRERFLELCIACEQTDTRVIIMVDAVDQLSPDDNRDHLIFIPEHLSSNVKFVMTCLPELDLVGRNAITIKPMDNAEKRDVIDGILKSHNRELEEKVICKMINLKASKNPLFLSLLVQRLLMMNRNDFMVIKKAGDDMDAISRHQLNVIATCPDSLPKMSAALLIEAGKRINETLARKVAEYLAVSRYGLRQEDLEALLGDQWSALDFAHFITYMNENFIQREDGRFDFSHKCIKEGFLKICRNEKQCHQEIVKHLYTLTGKDMLSVNEIAHHCIMADDKLTLLQYILNNEILSDTFIAVAKTLFQKCKFDHCEWLQNMFLSTHNRFDFIKLCEFAIASFDQACGSSLTNTQTLYQLSQFICEEIDRKNDNSTHDDISYNLLIIKAYIWHAQCNKKLLLASYYREGDYSRFISYYEKAYEMAETTANANANDNIICLQYMIECAFQLMYHDPQTNTGTYGNFETSSNYYIFYCKKVVECIEKIMEMIPKGQATPYMIKYAIGQISLACLEEYHIEKKIKIQAIHRGENKHIKTAIKIASDLEASGDSTVDELLILQLYQELADYFSDINNTEYMDTALSFLQKVISIFEKDPNIKISLDKKLCLQSVLIKYIKYQVALNNFDIEEYIERALQLTKDLYQKTKRLNLLYDVISLKISSSLCITQKGTCFSEVNRLLTLELNVGQYLYDTGDMPFANKILIKSILYHGNQYLLYTNKQPKKFFKKLSDPVRFGSTIIFLFFCFIFEPYHSIKSSFWIKPYLGSLMRMIKNLQTYIKLDDSGRKSILRIHRLIEFYLTTRNRQENRS